MENTLHYRGTVRSSISFVLLLTWFPCSSKLCRAGGSCASSSSCVRQFGPAATCQSRVVSSWVSAAGGLGGCVWVVVFWGSRQLGELRRVAANIPPCRPAVLAVHPLVHGQARRRNAWRQLSLRRHFRRDVPRDDCHVAGGVGNVGRSVAMWRIREGLLPLVVRRAILRQGPSTVDPVHEGHLGQASDLAVFGRGRARRPLC